LGRHRWVVERTLAWLARYRRLTVRYEQRADIHEAFLLLACSVVCLGYLLRPRGRNCSRVEALRFCRGGGLWSVPSPG
jgi:hypothetical protein